jgi:hypothetical protein
LPCPKAATEHSNNKKTIQARRMYKQGINTE